MTKDEALDLALEALESWANGFPDLVEDLDKQAITAIKQARSAPVQKPVAWIFKPNRELLWPDEVERTNPIQLDEYEPLYATPPAAQPAPVQEPYCYVYIEDGEEYFAPKGAYVPDNAQPLYTAPPAAPVQQEPIDLHPIETIKYWVDAYSNPASGEHFMGHGMVVTLLREYLSLREATPPAAQPAVPLTFARLCEIEEEVARPDGEVSLYSFGRAVEAAHGITAAPEKGQP